ncbi:MAG: IS3 family transposase, partial [Thermodesulfobacteriota bacterium]|nr:IS3 family transposase [Thermodesulfobacteriota bacterium]
VKYHRSFPEQPFDTVDQARQWAAIFVDWYNNEHQHSSIKFVTPAQRHRGEDHEILQRRKEVYAAAKNNRPERWSGDCRNWDRIEVVTLNYEQAAKEQLLLRANG